MEYLEEINRLLSIPNGLSNSRDAIYKSAVKFVQKLEKPGSDLGDKMKVDEMRPILSSVRTIGCSIDMECCFAIILKILLRKAVNRDAVGKFGMNAIVQWLGRQGLLASPVTPELGNVILNACFDSNNVMLFLNEGGMRPLLFLLRSQETLIQSSILGALQGICFTAAGKYHMRTCGDAIHSIVLYFMSDELVVRARAVGTIHNLSSDPLAIALIRDSGNYAAIPLLVTLLHDPSAEVCHAAAGTLQNLARDISSREMMHTIPECLERLIDLLFANDVKCQLAALGAVVNIMGPTLIPDHLDIISKRLQQIRKDAGSEIQEGASVSPGGDADESGNHQNGDSTVNTDQHVQTERKPNQTDEEKEFLYVQFKELLSDAIALGAVKSCIFDHSHSKQS